MEHVRYGKFIVLPFSDFQECIQKTKTVSAKPILPKTMSKRFVELVNQLCNYPDKIKFQGRKVIWIVGQSTNVIIVCLFKNVYRQHKSTVAEQLLIQLLSKIQFTPPMSLKKRVLAKKNS